MTQNINFVISSKDKINLQLRQGRHPGATIVQIPALEEVICNVARYTLPNYISNLHGHELVQQQTTSFANINVPEKGALVLLSTADPITVDILDAKKGSVVILGQVSLSGIDYIAQVCLATTRPAPNIVPRNQDKVRKTFVWKAEIVIASDGFGIVDIKGYKTTPKRKQRCAQ